ncbi:S-layer homology domain-containing protein [bacterium]|nr:S-layer homology domain-containing protein [bacterium]
MIKRLAVLFLAILMLAGFGCAAKKVGYPSPEDNPEHHYVQGMLALEKGDAETAGAKFERSLFLDKTYSPAMSGMALVMAMRAKGQADAKHQEVDITESMNYLKNANKKAKDNAQKFIYYTTAIRVNAVAKPKGWLDRCEELFGFAWDIKDLSSKVLPYYYGKEAAAYFMGKAYMEAYEFRKAEDKFALVLSEGSGGKWHPFANSAYQKTQKILRATAHSTIGNVAKAIAVKDEVNRADVAALLLNEVKLDKLFAGRIPVEVEIVSASPEFIPADIMDSPFRNEILTTLKWNLRGIEPQYDETSKAFLYKPESPVKRKELAMALEDILINLLGDENIATKHIGAERSLFPDVKASSAWYNAVTTVTSRGLMEPELSGEFKPEDYVDGASLLLAVFKLKGVLNIF